MTAKLLRPHAPRVPLGSRRRLHRRGAGRLLDQRRLLGQSTLAADGETSFVNPLAPKKPHFAGQGQERHLPVHVRRPEPHRHLRLQADDDRLDGKTIAVKTFGRGGHKNEGRVVGPKWKFKQYGQCGKWVCDLFPHLATCVDDIAFMHSMTADSPIHGSAMLHDELGQDPQRQPVPRLVGQLRPGQREREPARLRRDARPHAAARSAARRTGPAATCRRLSGHVIRARRARRFST